MLRRPRSGRRRIRLGTGLLVALATTSVTCGLLEAGLRLAGFRHPVLEVPIAVWNPARDRSLEEERSLFRSEVRQLWGLRPGARIAPARDEVVNEAGWRGPPIPLERTPGVLRVATMGDSSVFGMRVAWEETFTARLEDLLEERGRPTEILGAGVVGSTVRMGLWRWRELVRGYRPDVVVLGYGAINEHFPGFVSDALRIERTVWRARPLVRLARGLRKELRLLHLLAWVRDELQDREARLAAWIEAEARRQMEGDHAPPTSDWKGVRRVGVDEFERLLTQLVREVRADGAEPVLLSMPRSRAKPRPSNVLRSAGALFARS